MPKVSIIIPVYNVLNVLEKCLLSVKNQTFKDFEVIVLNDGSTDDSGKIAKEYCDTDTRFKYYEHANMGAGPTRNRGIELSSAGYIMFLDSDDFFEDNSVEVLYKKITSDNADIACGNFRYVFDDEQQNIVKSDIINPDYIDLNKMKIRDFSEKFYLNRKYTYNGWDKIYRKKFILDNNIVFGEDHIVFPEDNFFQLQIILNKPTISFTDKVIYNYYNRSNSLMNSFKSNLVQKNMNMIEILDKKNNYSRDDYFYYLLVPLIFETIIMEALNVKNKDDSDKKLEKSLDILRDYELFNFAIESIQKFKIYRLYKNRKKKLFIYVISLLEKYNAFTLSNEIIKKIYLK